MEFVAVLGMIGLFVMMGLLGMLVGISSRTVRVQAVPSPMLLPPLPSTGNVLLDLYANRVYLGHMTPQQAVEEFSKLRTALTERSTTLTSESTSEGSD